MASGSYIYSPLVVASPSNQCISFPSAPSLSLSLPQSHPYHAVWSLFVSPHCYHAVCFSTSCYSSRPHHYHAVWSLPVVTCPYSSHLCLPSSHLCLPSSHLLPLPPLILLSSLSHCYSSLRPHSPSLQSVTAQPGKPLSSGFPSLEADHQKFPTLGTGAQIPTGYMVKTLRAQSTCDSNVPND